MAQHTLALDIIDQELELFIQQLSKDPLFNGPTRLLSAALQNFITRPGKRIRPILLVLAYQGFTSQRPKHLYQSAIALELLHNFMLIHDDVIDRAKQRRWQPTLHQFLKKHLNTDNQRLSTNLAIITGDILFALAIKIFMRVSVESRQKKSVRFTYADGPNNRRETKRRTYQNRSTSRSNHRKRNPHYLYE